MRKKAAEVNLIYQNTSQINTVLKSCLRSQALRFISPSRHLSSMLRAAYKICTIKHTSKKLKQYATGRSTDTNWLCQSRPQKFRFAPPPPGTTLLRNSSLKKSVWQASLKGRMTLPLFVWEAIPQRVGEYSSLKDGATRRHRWEWSIVHTWVCIRSQICISIAPLIIVSGTIFLRGLVRSGRVREQKRGLKWETWSSQKSKWNQVPELGRGGEGQMADFPHVAV